MKNLNDLNNSFIGICGVNCMLCSAYLNKKKSCPTCRAPKEEHTRKSCGNCIKKKCAINRGVEYCFQCEKFPCSKIKNLSKRYVKNYDIDLIENGVRAKGSMNKFLAEQKKKYTCKFCGGIIDIHHKKCSNCGKES